MPTRVCHDAMSHEPIQYTGLHHVSLLISDLNAAKAFYIDVLGMEIDDGRPNLDFPGLWLKVGSQQIHLLLLDRTASGTGHEHPGRDAHAAITVKNIAPLQKALESAGIIYSMSRSGRRALFCRDPDGNGLEFVEQ